MKTVFKNVWVVTVNDQSDVIQNGVVVVEGEKITYVGMEMPDTCDCDRVIDGRGKKMLMPGFVNGHTHLPMVLFRSSADDLELHTWLNTRIFPMEDKLDAGSVQCGAELALAEMARNGVTTINDMYTQNRALIPALEKIPLRATLSMGMFSLFGNEDAQLQDNIVFFNEYNGALDGQVRVGLGPHAEYTNSESFFRKCAETAAKLNCPIHIHCSETRKEHEECKQRHGGLTPVQLMHKCGFFDDSIRTLLAHCVWLEDADIDILSGTKAAVLHNVCSNLKLASGVARVPDMLKKRVNVTLATDGAASNNNLDVWEEMRICALLHKGNTLDATVLPAEQALYMATRGGALALGHEDTGCIATGYRADLNLVNIDSFCYQPMTDLVHHIVYAGNSRDIELTMANGRVVCENGIVCGIDTERLYAQAQMYYDTVFSKA